MARYDIVLLRISSGIVFFWVGLLYDITLRPTLYNPHRKALKFREAVQSNNSIGGVMRFFAVFLTLSLTACATHPVSIDHASAVPSSRILAPHWLSQAQYTGSLVIKRDSGFMGSACTIRVFVDAVPVADLAPSEKVELFVPLGEHVVGVTLNGICGGGVSEAAVVIGAERQKILRIASGQSGDIYLQPSAF